jgi:hypothetical protein
MAHVAFVESPAAQAFRKYAKRNDIYVKGKRVRVDNPGRFLNLLTIPP